MKKILLFGFALLLSSVGNAEDMGKLISSDSPYLVNEGEEIEADGSPIVYIEGVRAPERAKTELDRIKLELFGTKDIAKATRSDLSLSEDFTLEAPENQDKNFTITTPFNGVAKAALIDHISDFLITIQILDKDTVLVSEDIYPMNTQEKRYFNRQLTFHKGTKVEAMDAVLNGKTLSISVIPLDDKNVVLKGDIPLDIGPNKIKLKYVLKNVLQYNGNQALLPLHLTGGNFIWPVDRMSALVLFPQHTKIIKKSLLFGSNEQEVPEAFETVEDSMGNVLYHFTHILPEKADIKTELIFDASSLSATSWWDNFLDSDTPLFFTLLSIAVALYLICSTYWETKKPLLKHLPIKIRLPFALKIPVILNSSITTEYVNNSLLYNKFSTRMFNYCYQKKWSKFVANVLLNIVVFFSVMWEFCLGVLALLILAAIGIFVVTHQIPMSRLTIHAMFDLFALIVLYKFFFKPYHRKVLQNIAKLAMNEVNMISLSSDQIRVLSPLMLATKLYPEWVLKLQQQNPNANFMKTKGMP